MRISAPLYKSVSTLTVQVLFAYRCRNCDKIVVGSMPVKSTGSSVSYFGYKEDKAQEKSSAKLPQILDCELRKVNIACRYPKIDFKCPHCGTKIPKNRRFDHYAEEKQDTSYNPLAALMSQLDLQSQDPRMQALIVEYARRHTDNAALTARACELDSGFADELAKEATKKREEEEARRATSAAGHPIEPPQESDYRKAISLYESVKKHASAKGCALAAERFEALGDYRDSASMADACRKMIEKLQNKKKTKKYALATAAAIVLIIAGYFVFNRYVQPSIELKKADRLAANGDYENALEIYIQQNHVEKIAQTQVKIGDLAMADGDYEGAWNLYSAAEDHQKAKSALVKMGDAAMESEDYEAAAQYYHSAEDAGTEKYPEALRAQFRLCCEKHDIRGAYDLYAQNKALIDANDIRNLILTVEDKADANAVSAAGKFGSDIRDIDLQILYCCDLSKAGYDLHSVYPDGVAVSVNLGQYTYVNSDSEYTEPKAERKIMVFAMYESIPEATFTNDTLAGSKREYPRLKDNYDYSSHNKISDDCYTFRFFPDIYMQIPEANRAESWEACNTLLIAESSYGFDRLAWSYENTVYGNLLHDAADQKLKSAQNMDEVISMISSDITYFNYKFNICYFAMDTIQLCSKEHPGQQSVLYYQYHPTDVNSYTGSVKNGEPDQKAMLDYLRSLVAE